MLLWRFMDEAERGTNRWIPKRAQPSRRSFRLFSQPRPEGLDEQDNGQTGDDRGRAHDLMVGFTSDKSHGGIQPLVARTLGVRHSNPRWQHRQKRFGQRAAEIERSTNQVDCRPAPAVPQYRGNTPLRIGNELGDWNRRCRRIVAQLVPCPGITSSRSPVSSADASVCF
jgi:hypothetical protein